MKKKDKTIRNISFMLFIFWLFSTSFDLRSSSGQKDFGKNYFLTIITKYWKEFIYYKKKKRDICQTWEECDSN